MIPVSNLKYALPVQSAAQYYTASRVALAVKNPPANTGEIRDAGSTLGWEDLLEEGLATHSSILVWRTQRTEDPGELQSMGHKVRHK